MIVISNVRNPTDVRIGPPSSYVDECSTFSKDVDSVFLRFAAESTYPGPVSIYQLKPKKFFPIPTLPGEHFHQHTKSIQLQPNDHAVVISSAVKTSELSLPDKLKKIVQFFQIFGMN